MGGQSESNESSCENVISESKNLNKRSSTLHKCNYEGCNASFKRADRLRRHMCIHTGERPFKCDRPNCDRAYTHTWHLKRHIATNHQNTLIKKTLKCMYPGCGVSLSCETNLKRHYHRRHEKLFSCKECGKNFNKNHHLRAHMVSHSGYLPFRCPKCNIGFASGSMLKRHQHCHKTYTCSIRDCTEEFQKWTEFRHHLKVAHPLEYVCAICEKKFNSKAHISSHILTHMRDRPTFPCPYPDCTRTYVRNSYLATHIKWFHEGKGVKCTYEGCGRMICTKARWTKHMAWHEKDHSAPVRPKTGKDRRTRFDKGVPRRSMAVVLSNIPPLPIPLEKKIISGGTLDSEEDQAIKVLGENDVYSMMCEPGTSSEEKFSTKIDLPQCSY